MMRNWDWHVDPKRFAFTFARYKFVAKMFEGYGRVLEVGCGDAFATRLVQQTVKKIVVADFDKNFIDDIESRQEPGWMLDARLHDMIAAPIEENFDGVYSLDVLEHVAKSDEHRFVANICRSLAGHGSAIFGMPSLDSQIHASPASKEGHVNCKTGAELRDFLGEYFHSVFIFSMNDEALHTGFFPMSHYLLTVCANKR